MTDDILRMVINQGQPTLCDQLSYPLDNRVADVFDPYSLMEAKLTHELTIDVHQRMLGAIPVDKDVTDAL